jgi:hypothetical protein
MLQVCGMVANSEKINAPLYEDAEISTALLDELDKIERRMKRRAGNKTRMKKRKR